MRTFFEDVTRVFTVCALCLLPTGMYADDLQLPDPGFEDWSGAAFDGNAQPKYWHGSNVSQSALGMTFNFNFTHKETGRSGSCVMVQDQVVGAAGITETGPGYFSMGYAWQHLDGLNTSSATAGTKGGYKFTHRPDSVSVWIKRTGSNTDKEDFHILYYSWSGTAKGTTYKNKAGGCTSVTVEDEESDVRIALNGNECKTETPGRQIAEGWIHERREYNNWVNIRIPIFYLNNDVPEKCNLIFSASNYPNYRANSGLYEGNSLYVDDVELIYSSKIQELYINDKKWNGFDPNSTEVQTYSLGNGASFPKIEARRGAGSLTNVPDLSTTKTQAFPGRVLSGSEIQIEQGDLKSKPTVITVTAEDGKKTVYKIQFQEAASSNAKLAGVSYTYQDRSGKMNTTAVAGFSPQKYNYTVDLPYGTKSAPVLSEELIVKQEDEQTVAITQAGSVSGTATIKVTAADKKTTATYTFVFREAALADNTLKDIKVNGSSVIGFTPSQAIYKVSLPTGTSQLTVEPVSDYPKGAQTIKITPDPLPTGEAINGSSVQISVTTPGNNTVAKVYKLNIKLEASSYSYLQHLEVNGDQIQKVNPASATDSTAIAFAPDQLTYYIHLKMGTKSLPQILWTPGDAYQTITKEEGGIDGTTRITVVAGNKTDQTVYKLNFSTEKSEISTLKGIRIGGIELEDFAPDKLIYTYTLPVGTTDLPEIEPIASDEFQKIEVTSAGVNGKTRITVTAGNGSTTIYQITFSVATFSDNTLKSLAVEGYTLAFDPQQDEYSVNLAKGTTKLPKVTYELQNTQFQTATVREPSSLNGDYKITVRPSSGASRTYIIHFSVDKSTNTALKAIYLDGQLMDGFHADTLHYIDSLPEGTSRIPNVTFEKTESVQRVLSVLEGDRQIITVTAESGATRVYTIQFVTRASANAFLKMIYLNGDSLADFVSETLNYEVELKSAVCPAITVDREEGQQVTITAPYAAGEAQIRVQPGMGAANMYTITFKAEAAATTVVRLGAILIDGQQIADFDPAKTHYEATYSGMLPSVAGVAESEGQTVSPAAWNGETAWIYVVDATGNKASYSIDFTRTKQTNSKLQAIYADGTLINGFSPEVLEYAYDIPAGSAYPEITYAASDETQVVYFGQTAEGEWTIKVAAENNSKTVYVVRYTIAKYSDATLENLEVEGHNLPYTPGTATYNLNLDEGADLPSIQPTARMAQTIMAYAASADQQEVLVTAENGTTKTYTINYTRAKSSNAALKSILVDGKSLAGFDPDSLSYTYELPTSTKVVPNIWAVGQLNNQTITTYYGSPDGMTRIRVMAQDSLTVREYTVAFHVKPATNTKLGRLVINGDEKNVDETDYMFTVPYGTVQPYDVEFTKASPDQLISYTLAPINDVTRIKVTAENGDSRNYTIRYKIAQPDGDNIIKQVDYSYVVGTDTTHESFVPVAGANIISLPYGVKAFSVDSVYKNYEEQSILFYNGGIRRGATIIASANRDGEGDVTYTITPQIPAYDTKGKLQSLRYKKGGQWYDVPNFRPDVYNYMINVTDQPTTSDFTAVAYDNKSVAKSTNIKKKQITLTVSGGEKYSVCWFYEDDEAPFTFNWERTNSAMFYTSSLATSVKEDGLREPTGYRPHGWTVPADLFAGIDYNATVSHFVYYSGKEVTRIGNKEAILSTIRGGALNSSIPGAMTLGGLSLPDGVQKSGGTKMSFLRSVNDGVVFRNTPEKFQFDYQPLSSYSINKWQSWVSLGGTSGESVEYTLEGNYSDLGEWKTASTDLSYTFQVAKMNILLCSSEFSGSNLTIYDGGTSCNADLQIRNVRMVYNSDLASVTVDGLAATKSTNTFTRNVSEDYVGFPELKFTGAVHDQMQVIEWLNDGEWLNGHLTARVINYGENSKDSTEYYVVLKRSAATSLEYDIDLGSYPQVVSGDTVYVSMPYGVKALPDIRIVPENIHQRFDIVKSGNSVSVTVMAENETQKTTVYLFSETLSDVTTLEAISAEDFYEATVQLSTPVESNDTTFYTFMASLMPDILYQRIDSVQGQKIVLATTTSRATLVVTAATGDTTHTYVFDRLEPSVTTNAQLTDFRMGSEDITDLGEEKIECVRERPTNAISFKRKFDADSVVFVQNDSLMQWLVYGSVEKTYTWKYPTTKSSKKTLKAVRKNGKNYIEFNPELTDYAITKDSALFLQIEPAESTQRLYTTLQPKGDSIIYTTTVKAENGDTKTYNFTAYSPKSEVSTLLSILVDSVPLIGFRPDSMNYTVVIPSPAYKRVEPQLPSITYVAGHAGQTIKITPASDFGEPTEIEVNSPMGTSTKNYTVTVVSEDSHCTELSGIMVNGVALDDFEPGSHKYSVMLKSNDVKIEYTSEDRFQTVKIDTIMVDSLQHYRYSLTVTAQDGVSTSLPYNIDVYIEKKSSDAQLANILLNGKNFIDFEPALNNKLIFDQGNNSYNINLPTGTSILPEVSAQLKMEGQNVEIIQSKMNVDLKVTAVDGTENTYHLIFHVPQSKNANLSMIFLNGDSLTGFKPDRYFYQLQLGVGVHELPEVAAQKAEGAQTIPSIETDGDELKTTIRVMAEDTTATNTYIIVFQYTRSAADTLKAIYADGDTLKGFNPQKLHYTDSLAVGTKTFPELSWEEADDWQNVRLDTVSLSPDSMQLVRRITVTAENGRSNTYIVTYVIRKSEINALQMLIVDQKQVENFHADTLEYYYTLTAERAKELNYALPSVEYIEGDEYQSVFISQVLDSLSGKSLAYKTVVTVTAAIGSSRTYFVHYPVEMSADATLNMINLGGKPLANFDAERYNYKVEIEMAAAIPVVSVIKKEDAQVYEIRVEDDTVKIDVWAENKSAQTYTLVFERQLSNVATLNGIELLDADSVPYPWTLFPFRSDVYEYEAIDLPYSADKSAEELLPTIIITPSDSLQTIDTVHHILPNGDIQIVVKVTAPNGEDERDYTITFHFIKPSDAKLLSLLVKEAEIAGFSPETTDYTYVHPYGTKPENFIKVEDISFVLSDSLATDSVYMNDEGTIFIVITAQDGTTENTYIIMQTVAADGDNALAWIRLDGDSLKGFDPDVTFYTYYLLEGAAAPAVEAEARSENAEVSQLDASAGDTCKIICTAADGSERRYYIHFAISKINPGKEPTSNDVLIKRIPGSMQYLVATIRQGVSIVLYNQDGQVTLQERVPVANPNAADVYADTNGDQSVSEQLNNVTDTSSGLVIDLIPYQPYFYVFFANEKVKIASGKIMALP